MYSYRFLTTLFLAVLLIIFPVGIQDIVTAENLADLESTTSYSQAAQFSSQGHTVSFRQGTLNVTNGSYALQVDFLDSNITIPESDSNSTGKVDETGMLEKVKYENLWNGIDLHYQSSHTGILESAYEIAPEANPSAIHLLYNAPVKLNNRGDLIVSFESGQFIESAPIAWQEIDGVKKPVTIQFEILDENEVGFALGAYNPYATLYIDPTLTWITFLGDTAGDFGLNIALDDNGNSYVTGQTYNPFDLGDADAFVSKLDTNGNVVWNTLLGARYTKDDAYAITLGPDGNIYVVGRSGASWGTPVRPFTALEDAFVAKLDPNGNLLWNSFLGGEDYDKGYGIDYDPAGYLIVTGYGGTWGTPIHPHADSDDGFVAKLTTSGNLIWNTFLGGDNGDFGASVVVGNAGQIYIAGTTGATWGNPVRDFTPSYSDAFAAELDPNGNLIWNTFLGGAGSDEGYDLSADGDGNLYIVGFSNEGWGNPVRGYEIKYDAFVVKLANDGDLIWNTFVGGEWDDWGASITNDSSGNSFITGTSMSYWGDPIDDYTAGNDGFVAKVDLNGFLDWSTFLGGTGYDAGYGIALDTSGYVYVTGESGTSWGNPIHAYSNDQDAFIAKYFGGVTHRILGNAGVGGTTLSYTDGLSKIATADSAGNYSISVSDHWSGTVTPSREVPPVELLSQPWHLSGNFGSAELYGDDMEFVLQGRNTLRITYNLHGLEALTGDASAIIFDQNGWKYISLSDYGDNGLDGVQTVDIPLSDFPELDPNSWVGTLHTRFWYSSQFNVDILSIVAYNNSLTGYTFSPPNRAYNNVSSDLPSQNYTAMPNTNSTISGNAGVAGAKLSYVDGTPKEAIADGLGNYSFTVSDNWSGDVIPSKDGYTFSPSSRTYTNVQTPQIGQNYDAELPAPGLVVINEVAWAGNQFNQGAEWIELYNPSASSINLNNWSLALDSDDGVVSISLNGTIPALGYYLLEATNDNSVIGVPADQTYPDVLLSNDGTTSLTLRNGTNQIVDTVNGDGGAWPAGFKEDLNFSSTFEFLSMERINPLLPAGDNNWATNDTHHRNGQDAGGGLINGTPKQPNSITFPENDTTCNNVPPIVLQQTHTDILRATNDIDPYRFDVNTPYTTIEATLTLPATGDFALHLFGSCQDDPIEMTWEIDQASHIGRRHINIGSGDEPNVEVRFNIGEETGTYYLAVQVPDLEVYSGAPYQLKVELQEPDFTTVKSLILYNPTRFEKDYGLDATSQVMDKLTQLTEHQKVDGVILQLDQFPEVVDAYSVWDNTPVINGNPASYSANVSAANIVSEKIRDSMRKFLQHNDLLVTDYVVVIGDDDQIPFRRLDIKPDAIISDPNWISEQTYFNSLVDDVPNTPIDAAMMTDQTLSDDYYGDYQVRVGAEFLQSFAVGRLLDTPSRILKTIDTFLSNNGEIDLTLPQSKKAVVAGYDFLDTAAEQMCQLLKTKGYLNTDCTLIDTPFTANDVYQKFILNAPNIAAFYGHTNHDQLLMPSGNPLTASQIGGANVNLSKSLWWVVGCQSGLVLPDSEHYSSSLTQVLGDLGVTYLGNTGWAYGSDGPLTYSELLYQLVATRLTQGGSIAIGEALRLAKQDYFLRSINNAQGESANYIFSYYNAKVMSEATLYGLPMLKYKFPVTMSVQSDSVMLPKAVIEKEPIDLALPTKFHPLPFAAENLIHVAHEHNGNIYYTNNGKYAFSSQAPVLPESEKFNFDTTLGQAKGVIWIGGDYNIVQTNNPLILKPIQLNASPGTEPTFNNTYPLLPVALIGFQELDGTYRDHLTFQTGQYLGNEVSGTLRLFTKMKFLVGLWNGTGNDETPPILGQLSSSINNNILQVELPITDSSGVYKAYMTYTEVNNEIPDGYWDSIELAAGGSQCASGQHTYSLPQGLVLTPEREVDYFIQVMDCNGNVSVKTDNGKYYQPPNPPIIFRSQGTQDGWILESSEASNKGGTKNSTATLLYVGDGTQDKQYKSILSFDTSSLPEDAVVTNVQLKVKVQGFVGGNMFTPNKILGNLLVDICNPYFGSSAGLVVSDFQSNVGCKNSIGALGSVPGTGWRTVTLKSAAYDYINLIGTTQFRLRFQKDDNDDLGADYLKIYSGNAGAANRPQLIITYNVP